jgi:hypothetical protein
MPFNPAAVNLPDAADVPQPGDDDSVIEIIDAYAKTELLFLASEGLVYSYGLSDMPTTIEHLPTAIHFNGQQGIQMAVTASGGQIGQYASSKTRDIIYVTTMLIVGHASEQVDMTQLQNKTLRWVEPFQRCYRKNTTMGGVCREVTLTGARWGLLERYAGFVWWGWYFFTQARAEYTRARG